MEQQLKEVRQWGNSGGVLVPKEWVGKQVKVALIDRTLDIKRETLKILEPYLDSLIGIYLVGSYARHEQTQDSDIDILAISKDLNKTIRSGKYEIEIRSMKNLISTLKNNPMYVYPKLIDAIPITNKALLEELREINIDRKALINYVEESKTMLWSNRELVNHDKEIGKTITSHGAIYSSLLRLKTLYILDCILSGKKYTNKDLRKYLLSNLKIDEKQLAELYSVYRAVYADKPIKEKIPISTAESLLDLLEKEIKKHGKKKKAA